MVNICYISNSGKKTRRKKNVERLHSGTFNPLGSQLFAAPLKSARIVDVLVVNQFNRINQKTTTTKKPLLSYNEVQILYVTRKSQNQKTGIQQNDCV